MYGMLALIIKNIYVKKRKKQDSKDMTEVKEYYQIPLLYKAFSCAYFPEQQREGSAFHTWRVFNVTK